MQNYGKCLERLAARRQPQKAAPRELSENGQYFLLMKTKFMTIYLSEPSESPGNCTPERIRKVHKIGVKISTFVPIEYTKRIVIDRHPDSYEGIHEGRRCCICV